MSDHLYYHVNLSATAIMDNNTAAKGSLTSSSIFEYVSLENSEADNADPNWLGEPCCNFALEFFFCILLLQTTFKFAS
jgi:hypothetical protein